MKLSNFSGQQKIEPYLNHTLVVEPLQTGKMKLRNFSGQQKIEPYLNHTLVVEPLQTGKYNSFKLETLPKTSPKPDLAKLVEDDVSLFGYIIYK